MPRTLPRLAALVAGLAAVMNVAAAEAPFPSKPVTMMIPYPAGGLSDIIGRVVNAPLGRHLGQPVIVENLGGVSGALAAQRVIAAPADGHLLFQGSPNELILAPLANAAVKFRSEEFRLVQMIGVAPIVLLGRKDLGAATADDVVRLAKAAPKTRPLTYGSVGTGSFYHVLGEHLAQTLRVTMEHVPYKGAAPLLQDMNGGHGPDIAMLPYSSSYPKMVEQGRLRVYGSLATTRPSLLPDLPTVNDGRELKDFSFAIWTAYMVRKDTPEPVVRKLNAAIAATLKDPEVRAKLEAQSFEVATPLSPADAAKAYENETSRYRAIAKAINLQPQ